MVLEGFFTVGRVKSIVQKRQFIPEVIPSQLVNTLSLEGFPTETEIGGTAGNGMLFQYFVRNGERTEEDVGTIDEYFQKIEGTEIPRVIPLSDIKLILPDEFLPDQISRMGIGIRFLGIRSLSSTAKAFNVGQRVLPPPTEETFDIKSTEFVQGRFRRNTVEFNHEEEKSIDSFLLPFNDSFMGVEVQEEPFIKPGDAGIAVTQLWISKLNTV